LLLALPLLRGAAGGPGWSAGLATGQNTVPVMDVLVVLGGLACIAASLAALRSRPMPAAGPFVQPAE